MDLFTVDYSESIQPQFFGSHRPISLRRAEKIAVGVGNWKLLGEKLGLSSNRLREVEVNYSCDVIQRKLEVLQLWLDRSVHTEELTLVQAVEKTLFSEST